MNKTEKLALRLIAVGIFGIILVAIYFIITANISTPARFAWACSLLILVGAILGVVGAFEER